MAKRINWGTSEEFIAKYEELKSSRKMGEFYNCNKTSVLNHAKEIGYDVQSNKKYKLSEQDKIEIIKAYKTKTSTELAKEYGVSRGMITKVWYDNNLSGKTVDSKSTTTAIDLTGQIFGHLTVISKSERRASNGGIYWVCRCDCGKEKEILGQSLRTGSSTSCGNHPNVSKGNAKIAELLDEHNVCYELEKKFSTCIDKTYLPFDFFVEGKYVIEYDGQQHYDKNSVFNYEYTHKHDLMKNDWCRKNNIPLIRIPYTHYENLKIEDLLLETSSFIYANADDKLRN